MKVCILEHEDDHQHSNKNLSQIYDEKLLDQQTVLNQFKGFRHISLTCKDFGAISKEEADCLDKCA